MSGSLLSKIEVACFGEVLWDVLPDGAQPGGAPMNVAYHLGKLGISAAVISRIGRDKLGNDLLELLQQKNVTTTWLQQGVVYPTGTVDARPTPAGDMEYTIGKPAAWDFIEADESTLSLVTQAAWFVYGSLACRNRKSHETLLRLLEAAQTKVLDINLRAPFYSARLLHELLSRADLVKLNISELEILTAMGNHTGIKDRMTFLQDRYPSLQSLIVTCGPDGAYMKTGDELSYHRGYRVTVADTVGSGDAFLAAIIKARLSGYPQQETLQFAGALGAIVASRSGACPEYRSEEIQSLAGFRAPMG